jgi:hypothetical protein
MTSEESPIRVTPNDPRHVSTITLGDKQAHRTHDLNALIGLPGGGKTYEFIHVTMNLVDKDKGNHIIIFTKTHELLGEIGHQFSYFGRKSKQWYGIGISSSGYDRAHVFEGKYLGPCDAVRVDDDKYILKLFLSGVPQRIVCRICKRRKCEYKSQFKTDSQIVLAPLYYMTSKVVRKYAPTNIFIDDATYETRPLADYAKVSKWFDGLKSEGIVPSSANIIDYLTGSCNHLLRKSLEEYVKERLNKLEDIDPVVLKYDAGILTQWGRIFDKFGHTQTTWADPYIIYAFPYVLDGVRVTFCEASPDVGEQISKVIVKQHLLPEDTRLRINTFEINTSSRETNALQVIDRVYSNRFNEVAFTHEIVVNYLPVQLRRIMYWLGAHRSQDWLNKSIGIITWLDVVTQIENTQNIFARKRNILYINHGAAHGLNKLENVDRLIVLGNYAIPVETILREYLYMFHERPVNTDYQSINGRYKFVDGDLQWFAEHKNEACMYQALHRCRFIFRPAGSVRILLFGYPPEAIKREAIVRNVLIDEDGVHDYISDRDWLIQYLQEHKDPESRAFGLIVRARMKFAKLVNLSSGYEHVNKIIEENADVFEVVSGQSSGKRGGQSRVISLKC